MLCIGVRCMLKLKCRCIGVSKHFSVGQKTAQKVGICVCSRGQSWWIWGVWGWKLRNWHHYLVLWGNVCDVQLYAVVPCMHWAQSGLVYLIDLNLGTGTRNCSSAYPSFCTDARSQQGINLSDLLLHMYVLCLILPRLCHCLVRSLPGFSIPLIASGERT